MIWKTKPLPRSSRRSNCLNGPVNTRSAERQPHDSRSGNVGNNLQPRPEAHSSQEIGRTVLLLHQSNQGKWEDAFFHWIISSNGIRSASINDKKMTIAVRNGHPKHLEAIITALESICCDRPSMGCKNVLIRFLQEAKRSAMRSGSGSIAETSTLFTRSLQEISKHHKLCSHCGKKRHADPCCCEKNGLQLKKEGNEGGIRRVQEPVKTRWKSVAVACRTEWRRI